MVTRSGLGWQGPDWKQDLRQSFTRPDALLAFLGLPAMAQGDDAAGPARGFRMLVPLGYAALMEPGNPDDPLLRQVLPSAAEEEVRPGFTADPVGDATATLAPGLLQKYRGRALLVTTPACAIHCRYCFRRHYPYAEAALGADGGAAAIAGIAANPSITEIILSGGDPLMFDDGTLASLIGELAAIPHLERLRLHTRLPVVLPSRVTPALCRLLSQTRLQGVVVVHANHPRELGDAADTLCALSEGLFRYGVLPYYLHLLDRVQGAAHFEVPPGQARSLIAALRLRLPGYLVPRLVREEAGAGTKIAIA
jgi:KamA family protein